MRVSPVIGALTEVSNVPVIGLGAAVTVVPYAVVKPNSKVTVVLELLALMVPLRVAFSDPITLAAFVVAVGTIAEVVKFWSEPFVVPSLFTPTTR